MSFLFKTIRFHILTFTIVWLLIYNTFKQYLFWYFDLRTPNESGLYVSSERLSLCCTKFVDQLSQLALLSDWNHLIKGSIYLLFDVACLHVVAIGMHTSLQVLSFKCNLLISNRSYGKYAIIRLPVLFLTCWMFQ